MTVAAAILGFYDFQKPDFHGLVGRNGRERYIQILPILDESDRTVCSTGAVYFVLHVVFTDACCMALAVDDGHRREDSACLQSVGVDILAGITEWVGEDVAAFTAVKVCDVARERDDIGGAGQKRVEVFIGLRAGGAVFAGEKFKNDRWIFCSLCRC